MARKQKKIVKQPKESKKAEENTHRNPPPQLPKLKITDLKAKIKARFANSQKAQNHKQKAPKEQILEVVDLDCPICYQLMLKPTITQCGHSFCLNCAEGCVISLGKCPVCRAPASWAELVSQPIIERMADSKLDSMSQAQRENFRLRKAELESTEAKKKVGNDLKSGDRVDFWWENLWRQGAVRQIITQANGSKMVLVNYVLRNGRTEVGGVELGSRFLARHRTYTRGSR